MNGFIETTNSFESVIDNWINRVIDYAADSDTVSELWYNELVTSSEGVLFS